MIDARAAKRFWQFAILSISLLFASGTHAQLDESLRDIESSIIKIYTTSAAPDYFTPWRLMNPSQSSGSGAVISNRRILTNAHVVADPVMCRYKNIMMPNVIRPGLNLYHTHRIWP